MEKRLTTNNGGGHYLDLSDSPFSYDNIVCKLGEFEDFMESLGLEDLEELEHLIGYPVFIDGYDKQGNEINKIQFTTYKKSFNELFEKNKKLKQEKQALKDRWNKLKEWIEQLCSETEVISEDLYFLKYKMQELEQGVNNV